MSIGVVIATIGRGSLKTTMRTIREQTLQPDRVVTVNDPTRRGAPWARNRGVAMCPTDWIVFSDDDIMWEPRAFEYLRNAIDDEDFSYGSYGKGEGLYCIRPFSVKALRKNNYISTMSMVRRSAFPGFDESLTRLQDWDLWLTMVERGSVGVHCGELIFRTVENGGISSGDDWTLAARAVRRKHGL